MVWEISVYVHHVNCMRIINKMDVLIVLLYIYMNHENCRISAKLTKALTCLFCYIAFYFQQTFSLYNKSTSALLRFWKRPGLTFPNFILDYKLLYCWYARVVAMKNDPHIHGQIAFARYSKSHTVSYSK